MRSRWRFAFVRGLVASLLGLWLAAEAAAQTTTTTTTGPSVALTQQLHPDRIDVNGNDLGQSTRAQNLNPTGISYDDCAQNLRLHFTVAVSGFTGADNLQVWATNAGSCQAASSRGTGGVPTCWLVNQGATGLVSTSLSTLSFDIWVRDLVGPQSAVPSPTGLGATQARGEAAGLSACATQPSFLAVPIDIWFMALKSSGDVDGTPLDYTISTDLIGPPAPTSVGSNDGDTLSIVTWQTNSDSDTTSYDVFIDPIPGQEGTSATGASDATVVSDSSVLICPDTGSAAAAPDASDASDASDDTGATLAASSDAGCYTVNVGGSSTGTTTTNGTCASSSVLTASSVQDSGAVSTLDDAGNVVSTTSGSGGISGVPTQNLVAGGSSGVTVSDKSTGTFTITGLRNGSVYNVAVAAVDGSGNVGPSSTQACVSPAPVLDFWSTYRAAGGQAGGGFCALEAAGAPASSLAMVPLGLAAFALARRRRSRRAGTRSAR